ncbi:MAG: AMP-binding protein, partial [Alphaproteobacteria bacterium]|nr:AMP-binding protein [Alphaproteobacteria bacterium]
MPDGTDAHTPPTEVSRAAGGTVGRLFAATARLWPQRTALIQGERRLSYGALAERVDRLASVMRARGVGRGDRVGLLSRNDMAFIEV